MIGDIEHDPKLDKPNFKICNGESKIVQYYALGEKAFEGEKIKIEQIFKEQFDSKNIPSETGMIRIRFIVNCEGETDRFRVIGMDEYYQPKTFDSRITSQLVQIAKDLKGWKSFEFNGIQPDYYQYLLFKFENGQLIEILP